MSDSLETEVKTNPQGDPITSAAPAPASKEGGRKDPHAEAKKQKETKKKHVTKIAERKNKSGTRRQERKTTKNKEQQAKAEAKRESQAEQSRAKEPSDPKQCKAKPHAEQSRAMQSNTNQSKANSIENIWQQKQVIFVFCTMWPRGGQE